MNKSKVLRSSSKEKVLPEINSVINIDLGANGYKGSVGDFLRITGARLAIDTRDPLQGVFFTSASGEKKRASVYNQATASKVECKIPKDIAPGEYHFTLSALFGKEYREGGIEKKFTIV